MKGVIQLNNTVPEEENVLEKYSFSHALSQSGRSKLKLVVIRPNKINS